MSAVLRVRLAALAFAVICMTGSPVRAEGVVPGYGGAQSTIDGGVLGNARGVIAVNMAAGDGNVQMNATALAANAGKGVAQAQVSGLQMTEMDTGSAPDVAMANIAQGAFAGAAGLISVNQASGQGNAQANGLAIALGIDGEVVAESVLGATVSGQGLVEMERNRGMVQSVTVDDTAFAGARGVVQINQLAGSGNATANNLSLSIRLGGGSSSEQ